MTRHDVASILLIVLMIVCSKSTAFFFATPSVERHHHPVSFRSSYSCRIRSKMENSKWKIIERQIDLEKIEDAKRLVRSQLSVRGTDSNSSPSKQVLHSVGGGDSPQPVREVAVGIDLGTTYSAISILRNRRPEIIPVDGHRIIPSVVSYLSNGTILTGYAAKAHMALDPMSTFSSFKRVIGRTLQETRETGDRLPVLKINKHTPETLPCELVCESLNRRLKPEEVSSEIIRTLLGAARSHLGDGYHINRAVITVPAYFSPSQCDATIRAGEIAGLSKIKLVREPEAAALAYGFKKKQNELVLVFDLGGGTYDLSVLEVGGGYVEVVATGGDAHLGGDDFNEVIACWIFDQITSKYGESVCQKVRSDPFSRSAVYEEAEAAKRRLTTEKETVVSIQTIKPSVRMESTLTRAKFEAMSRHLVQRLLQPLREVAIMAGINLPGESGQSGLNVGNFSMTAMDALENAFNSKIRSRRHRSDQGSYNSNSAEENGGARKKGEGEVSEEQYYDEMMQRQIQGRRRAVEQRKSQKVGKEFRRLQKDSVTGGNSLNMFPGGQDISDVILVGGATRMNFIHRLVRVMTGISPRKTVNPDEVVSLGAAVMAGILDGQIEDMQVMNQWQAAIVRALDEYQKKVQGESLQELLDKSIKRS